MLESIDSVIESAAREESFSGVVLLKKGGEHFYSKAVGFANRSHKVPNTLETRFNTASITKVFTAVSVLQLIERKKLSFETTVRDLHLDTHIPDEVTVYQLLTHTSGITDYFDESEEDVSSFENLWKEKPNYSVRRLKDFLPLFADESPILPPGKEFRYSNAGYILLGLLIEMASGLSYFDYVRENIFEKALMRDSDFISFEEVHHNVAEGYIPVSIPKGKWRRNIYATPPYGASDGGAFTTAGDLAHFMGLLRNGELLCDDLTKEILIPHVDDEVVGDNVWKYGFGMWFLLNKRNDIIRYGLPGEDPGVSCRLFYYPLCDIDVIILGNQSDCAGSLGWKIHDVIMEKNCS